MIKEQKIMVAPRYGFSFYIVGGTLPHGAPSYVERQADDDLYINLNQGNYCYVLSQRQMGKSSLMVRTAARLRREGVAAAVLDLTALGLNLTAEQWYGGLLDHIGRHLNLEEELEDYWMERARLGPLQRWMAAIRDVVLKRHKGMLVIFIDEVDAVLSLPFSTDEFFAGIREFHNRRNEDEELKRLTFCLMGVATPSDLVRDVRLTPFNIAKRIDLADFTESEATVLTKGMPHNDKSVAELIKRVIYWTGGHPYLTQCLCKALAEDPSVSDTEGVDRVCKTLFLTARNREQNDNLNFVSNRILLADEDTAGLLTLYARIHRHNGVDGGGLSSRSQWLSLNRVRDDETNPLVRTLWLSGIIRIEDGYIYVRNRVYYRVFDREWVNENMPGAELRRQRTAYRQGVLRAAIIAAIIILLILGLAVYALVQRNRAMSALNEAQEQRRIALDASNLAEDQRSEAERQILLRKEAQRLADYKGKQANLLTWELIKNDANPLTLQAYLELNPPEEFAAMARGRLQSFKSSASAQAKGVIRGRVYDVDSDEPIVGAVIKAKNQANQVEFTMFSNTEGQFIVPMLPAGTYTITIEYSGYE